MFSLRVTIQLRSNFLFQRRTVRVKTICSDWCEDVARRVTYSYIRDCLVFSQSYNIIPDEVS